MILKLPKQLHSFSFCTVRYCSVKKSKFWISLETFLFLLMFGFGSFFSIILIALAMCWKNSISCVGERYLVTQHSSIIFPLVFSFKFFIDKNACMHTRLHHHIGWLQSYCTIFCWIFLLLLDLNCVIVEMHKVWSRTPTPPPPPKQKTTATENKTQTMV